ncbi:MAG: 6-phosphogluconolactonase [Planctomycetota bacterium]
MDANQLRTYEDNPAVAKAFAEEMVQQIEELTKIQDRISIAVSGGSTPKLLFELLGKEYRERIDWGKLHFFWVDDRCVPADSPESNYGQTKSLLFDHVDLPEKNIFWVQGEKDPAQESQRYESLIREWFQIAETELPEFDLLFLGMGTDGHTASIFPHEMELLNSNRLCEVATHPETGQKRITLTGPVINAAAKVYFLITGSSKKKILDQILNQKDGFLSYPAAHIHPSLPAKIYTDKAAVGIS